LLQRNMAGDVMWYNCLVGKDTSEVAMGVKPFQADI